ncbi:branched-chain amino acid ABC transporter permease/ATP-binding protein [Pseudonocardia sp. KRD291]|uniref:branched-chain amino acid ABC transporter permease/ATP-binding protein n=1 Tax=Pseudonocardia sp. KRD291 TaxID=2792007 RepID=UPI001C4A453D|nr:branched-chain amino acid ABC transporter permease/ATP-binding protein [Pseudonocardia sp. KRD291]MBW0101244.1 ATP-binding cassette domain-containing protein [Pseudonocardia sp. KRD291]
MAQHVVFLLLGLGNGAVFGALALALTLTYRSSGIINFATGSIALLAAYVYAYLRKGELILLVPGLPKTVDIGVKMPMLPALLIAVALSGLLGLVLHLLVFRPLRDAPPVAKAVASLGVSLVITALIAARMGTTAIAVAPIFPVDLWNLGAVKVPGDRIYLAVLVVVVAGALALVFRRTRFGLATRAAAESEKGAFVSGVSPDRVAAGNWVISSAVAGLAGILIAPIVPLIPVSYTLFIVPALAAAIIARFQNLVWAVAAGLAIGALQSEVQLLQTLASWLPSSGLPELVPLVLILLVLVVRARPLPGRGTLIVQNLGRAPRPRHLLLPTLIPVVLAVAGLALFTGVLRGGLISTFIFAIIALSVVVVTGYAGQVSFAQLPLAGVAAFLLAPLAGALGVPFPIAPLLAALGATVIGVVIGLPALRIRGLTVAVVTFALAFALEALWFRNLAIAGSEGLPVPPPTLFGIDLGIGTGADFPRIAFGVVCLVVLVAVALGVALLRRSRLGSQMLAVRANERSAAAAGVDVVRVKLAAFAIGAFLAGLGGALLAYKLGTVTFDPFTAILGLTFFGTVYLAGATSVAGGLLAGVTAVNGVFYVLVGQVVPTGLWYEVVAAILLVLTVVLNPEGIVGPAHELIAKRRGQTRAATGSVVAPTAVPAARRPRPTGAPPGRPDLLSVRGLTVQYGGVLAVDDISLDVPQGHIVGLIGPNGAGKTTAVDGISGFAGAQGAVVLDGRHLTGLRPHQRIRAGLGRTFQAIELYEDLTVQENVSVGLTARQDRTATDALAETLDLLGLAEVAERPAGELSQGQRQLVSIARALVGRPAVLLLDEPAGGLDTAESAWLGERLRDVRDSGVTILMIEHDMSLVLGLCDEIYVLDFGQVIAHGTPAEIRTHPRVAEAYLGSTHAAEVTA